MNQDEAGRIVHDGAWPIIAGRRVANNSRWGQPDGVLELYQQGSEGPQWWTPWPDTVRNLPIGSILDRCNTTNTCPKVIEHFGGSEVFALKMTTSWVGTSADADIPLPANVRRYYIPSTTHGGGGGGFSESTSPTGANCPGNNWNAGPPRLQGQSRLRDRDHQRPASGDAQLDHERHAASAQQAIRRWRAATSSTRRRRRWIPERRSGVPASIFLPENFVNPVFDYDWGPNFNEFDATGNPTNAPPPSRPLSR
jgi:hypothetical protein